MVWSRSPMDASFFQRSTIGGASISTPTKIDRAGILQVWISRIFVRSASSTVSRMLFSASEADSRGEGSALASRKLPEIGGVDVVRYDVGILPVDSIHHLDARGPQISAKGELLF